MGRARGLIFPQMTGSDFADRNATKKLIQRTDVLGITPQGTLANITMASPDPMGGGRTIEFARLKPDFRGGRKRFLRRNVKLQKGLLFVFARREMSAIS